MSQKKHRCILHVGMYKTGSTSIQQYLFNTRDTDTPCLYCCFDIRNSGFGLAHLFYADLMTLEGYRVGVYEKSKMQFHQDESLKYLEEKIEQAKRENKVLLFSWEGCWSMKPSELESFRDFMENRDFEVEIIAYVRPWKALYESTFQQRIKMGLSKFDPLPTKTLEFRSKVEKFDRVFGVEQVKVFKFSPDIFPDNNVVRHFCMYLGIEFDAAKYMRVNESLSLPAVKLLYAFNKFGSGNRFMGDPVYHGFVMNLFNLKGNALRLHSSLFSTLSPAIEAERPWLEKRIGTDLNENFAKYDRASDVIREEIDMFQYESEALQWLALQIGATPVSPSSGVDTARQIARQMQLLLDLKNNSNNTLQNTTQKMLPKQQTFLWKKVLRRFQKNR